MYLIDGVQVEKEDFILPVENIGVWRGDGIFEAIRIHEGYPFGIDLHIERFKKSASKVFFEDINFEKHRYYKKFDFRNSCRNWRR